MRTGAIARGAADLLRAADLDTRLAAAKILRQHPTPEALDALWALRVELEHEETQNPRAVVSAAKALAACSRSAGDWVGRKIRQADSITEPVYALAYLLPQIENEPQLWSELKHNLLTKVTLAKERSIVACIEAFRDQSCTGWLRARCGRQDNYLGSSARRALFVLEPGRPPDPFTAETWEHLAGTHGWWLLPHLNAGSLETEQLIGQAIASHEDPWQVAWSLRGFENRIDPGTLDLLLDSTGQRLDDELAAAVDEDRDSLLGPCRFLARIQRLPLVECFEARRETSFETSLTRWLCERGTRGGGWNLTGKRALRVLKRIGGAGVTDVAHHYLGSASPRLRESACIAAEVAPWSDDLAHALREHLYDPNLTVRLAANQALDRLWHVREIDRLVEQIGAESSSARRWCLLEIVLEGAHPGLNGDRPQLWMIRLFSDLPLAMRQHALNRLSERRKKLLEELRRRQRS